MTITDVGLVRQLPLNMSHDSEKPKLNPLAKFFFKGDFTYESEKWVKHRRILNPAFHMEKLKVLDSYLASHETVELTFRPRHLTANVAGVPYLLQ